MEPRSGSVRTTHGAGATVQLHENEQQTTTAHVSQRSDPAHVLHLRVNNPTLEDLYFVMIGKADIEESKSNVAANAWLPQASYPSGNFSDTSSFKF